MGSESFSDGLRGEASHIWERILEHPFVVEMRGARLPLDKFRYYIEQDYAFLTEFSRCLGIAAAKAEDRESMITLGSIFNSSLTVEVEMLEGLAEKLGVSREDLRRAEASPTNLGYTRHLICVAFLGSVGEALAALLPCVWTYLEIGARAGEGGSTRGHPVYSEWFDTYRSREYAELVNLFKDLTDGYDRGSGPSLRERMRRHFVLSSRYEYMFWDMSYRKEEWPV